MRNTIERNKKKYIIEKKESRWPAVGFATVKWQPKHIDAQLTQNEWQFAKSEKYGFRIWKIQKKEKKILNKKKESFRPAVGFVSVKWQPKYIDAQLTEWNTICRIKEIWFQNMRNTV